MNTLVTLIKKHQQFLLYCLCGGSGVTADYIVFYILQVSIGIHYQIANASGYLAGTLLSFALNRVITFNIRDKTSKRLALFLTTAGIGYLASFVMMWLLVDIVVVDEPIAKLLTLPMVVVLQFTLNKRITFKS